MSLILCGSKQIEPVHFNTLNSTAAPAVHITKKLAIYRHHLFIPHNDTVLQCKKLFLGPVHHLVS